MHALVAQAQCGRELPQRRATKVQATHRAMKLGPGEFCGVFGLDEFLFRPPRR
jgi:hypothetical protein